MNLGPVMNTVIDKSTSNAYVIMKMRNSNAIKVVKASGECIRLADGTCADDLDGERGVGLGIAGGR